MQMGQCGPHLHSSSTGLLLWGLFNTRAWGMAVTLGGTSTFSILITVGVSVGGIGQDALALNKFVEAGMVLGHGVSSLFCGVVAVTAASGCCSWDCYTWGQIDLLPLGIFLWDRGFSWTFLGLKYIELLVRMWQLWLLNLPLVFGLSP